MRLELSDIEDHAIGDALIVDFRDRGGIADRRYPRAQFTRLGHSRRDQMDRARSR